MPVFKVEHNEKVLGSHVLNSDLVTVGRSRDNTIMIANGSVSRHHARIEREGDRYVLTDRGSLNGTLLNGERIARALLSRGDRIEVGEYTIVFEEESLEDTAALAGGRKRVSEPESSQPAEMSETQAFWDTSVTVAPEDGQESEGSEPESSPFGLEMYQADEDPTTVVLALKGHVEQSDVSRILAAFDEMSENGEYNVVVDFSEAEKICDAAWGGLLGVQSRLAEDELGLKLAEVHEGLYERFRSLPFSSLFACYPTVEEAVEALKRESVQVRSLQTRPAKDEGPLKVEQRAATSTVRIAPDSVPREVRETGSSKADMTLEDKICAIVAERPFQSDPDIRDRLKSDEYGNVEVGRFKLKALLKKLGLHTRLRRYQYFLRS